MTTDKDDISQVMQKAHFPLTGELKKNLLNNYWETEKILILLMF